MGLTAFGTGFGDTIVVVLELVEAKKSFCSSSRYVPKRFKPLRFLYFHVVAAEITNKYAIRVANEFVEADFFIHLKSILCSLLLADK